LTRDMNKGRKKKEKKKKKKTDVDVRRWLLFEAKEEKGGKT